VALITAPDRPAGRGRRARANPMAAVARERGLPVLQPERASTSEALDAFRALAPDLGVVVAYGQILSPEFLAVPREGCINLHASLLPRWRGASPIQAALLAGDPVTGVTLQRVVPELDAGPVLARRETPVGPRETAPELAGRRGPNWRGSASKIACSARAIAAILYRMPTRPETPKFPQPALAANAPLPLINPATDWREHG